MNGVNTLNGPHGDEDQIGDDMAADQRQPDVAELLPARGAGDIRGLEIARRDRREGRVEQHHREGRAAPGVEEDDHPERLLQQASRPPAARARVRIMFSVPLS